MGMWVKRVDYEGLSGENRRLAGDLARCSARYTALKRAYNRATERYAAELKAAGERYEKLMASFTEVARKPPLVIEPPDTATIVKEAINGMATVLNGWQQANPALAQEQREVLSLDKLGLGADAGVTDDLPNFVPPWENVPGTTMTAREFANDRGYTPYVPGQGNSAPPHEGGMVE